MDTYQDLLSSLPLCVKRGPYIKYKNYTETVDKVMQIFKNFINANIQEISIKTGFKARTLYNWKMKLKENHNFNPLDKQVRNNSRIFTENEEDSIAEYIWTNKIKTNKCFNDEDCIVIITDAYLEKHQNDKNIDITYVVSKGYIYEFKKRHAFVSKLCHLKRRPAIKQQAIESFLIEMNYLFDNVKLNRIINIDETAIFIAPKNLKIWHSKGKNDVIIPVKYNDKERVTCVCAVRADGTKFNMQFIAKGETAAVLDTQIGDVHPHSRTFSKKGWTDKDTFYEFLNYIKSQYDDDDDIHIILDRFSAHKCEEIINAAQELGIILHFIPSGLTDLYQPLDVKLFAIIKAYLKHMLRQFLKDERPMTKHLACQCMIKAWEKLPEYYIEDSFTYLTMEDRWQGGSQYDLSIMHTCRYNAATPVEQKKLVLNELVKTSYKDESGTPVINYVLQSFYNEKVVSLDHIISFVKANAKINCDVIYGEEEEEDAAINEIINGSINLLISYRIIERESPPPLIMMKKLI